MPEFYSLSYLKDGLVAILSYSVRGTILYYTSRAVAKLAGAAVYNIWIKNLNGV
jgi:hypothetical protein